MSARFSSAVHDLACGAMGSIMSTATPCGKNGWTRPVITPSNTGAIPMASHRWSGAAVRPVCRGVAAPLPARVRNATGVDDDRSRNGDDAPVCASQRKRRHMTRCRKCCRHCGSAQDLPWWWRVMQMMRISIRRCRMRASMWIWL